MPRAAKSPQPSLCVVTIGYQRLLLPMEKGLKVVQLMQGAIELEHICQIRGPSWRMKGQPELELSMVKQGDIEPPRSASSSESGATQFDLLPAPGPRRLPR